MIIVIDTKRKTVRSTEMKDITVEEIQFLNFAFDKSIEQVLRHYRGEEGKFNEQVFLRNITKKPIPNENN